MAGMRTRVGAAGDPTGAATDVAGGASGPRGADVPPAPVSTPPLGIPPSRCASVRSSAFSPPPAASRTRREYTLPAASTQSRLLGAPPLAGFTVRVQCPGATSRYAVVVANATPSAIVVPPATATSSTGARTDAWMMRTLACPSVGRARSSVSTRSPRSANRPTPATVYAAPATTVTCVLRTGGAVAAAPAVRIATAYVPVGTVR